MEKQIVLRPIDVVILLKKITPQGVSMNGKQISESLGISQAEVSVAMERNRIARLVDDSKTRINVLSFKDFLIHGVRFCFPVRPGGIVRGVSTASSASVVSEVISTNGEVFVWGDPSGEVRGQSIIPLYSGAVVASRKDPDLYALLVIVDTLRIGGAREREIAIEKLDYYLDRYVSINKQ